MLAFTILLGYCCLTHAYVPRSRFLSHSLRVSELNGERTPKTNFNSKPNSNGPHLGPQHRTGAKPLTRAELKAKEIYEGTKAPIVDRSFNGERFKLQDLKQG
jgi:hypothetical protein